MNNAERIAAAIDHHLTEKSEIVVFGSAALMLDRRYAEYMPTRVTHDVDIIIPNERELKMDSDRSFWHAIDAANKELEPEGLYVTHIFPEREVTLTPEWQQHAVRLENPALNNLTIIRPRILDLIISKMGRGDTQDLEDVRTLMQLEQKVTAQTIRLDDVRAAAERARVPAVYQEIFPAARNRVIATVEEVERAQMTRDSAQPKMRIE